VQSTVQSQVALSLESFEGRRAAMLLSHDFGRVSSTLAADVYRSDSHRKGAWTDRDNIFWNVSAETDQSHYSVRLNHYDADFEAAGYVRYDRLSAGLVGRKDPEENALLPYGNGRRTALVFNRAPAMADAGVYATAYIEDFERVRGAAGGGVVHNAGADDRNIIGGRVAYRATVGRMASIETGVEARRDDGTGVRRRYENRQPTSTYLTYLDMDLLTYGAFAQAQYKPLETVKLHAGLRSDWFDYDIANLKVPAASTAYRDSVITPKLGAVWSISPALDVFANVAQGFRSPAAQQITPSGSASPLNASGGAINDQVSPSKVESYDAGFVVAPIEGWTATATYFYTLNEDEIVQTGPNVFASVGDTTREGFELETRAQLLDWFATYASYTRLFQADIDDAAPGAANKVSVPKHQAKLGAELLQKLSRGSLRYNVDAYATRGIPYFAGTPLTQLEVPTYVRYDVRAAYDIGSFQIAAFAIVQPHLISESFYATSAGLWVSSQPREHYGLSLRYSF
jgi:outer membrane receptor protein involved in Fe transport